MSPAAPPPVHAPAQAPEEPVLRQGARVLRDAGRLVAEHWPALTVVAMLAYVSRSLLLDLAVVASRTSPVLSNLVQALVPFVQLLLVVVMFLVLRARHEAAPATPLGSERPAPAGRRARGAVRGLARGLSPVVVASAAVLIPFLLIYEHDGALVDDSYAVGYAAAADLEEGGSVYDRLAQATSVDVLATVACALVARRLLTTLVRRVPAERAGRRASLRMVAGYLEAVWIVLGAVVVRETLGSASTWWHTRVAGVAVDEWWAGVGVHLPQLAAWVDAVLAGGALLVAAAITGILVPLAWLNLAAVVYGVEAASVLHARDLAPGRLGSVVSRVGDDRTQRALGLLTDPERRFGAAVGAAGLIARAGWRPVLVVCLAFLVTDNVDLLLWEAVRAVVGPQTFLGWDALDAFVDGVGTIAARVLTLALVASAANAILVRLGLPDTLRLRRA